MDKSLSESELNLIAHVDSTPPNFSSTRCKRKRTNDAENDRFAAFQEEMRTLITSMFETQESEIKKIHPILMDLRNTNANLESTISFLAGQNKDLKTRLEVIERQSKKDQEQLVILEEKLENMQRECRKSNLEIKNVPRLADEQKEGLIQMIMALSKTTGCNVTKSDIKDIYRAKGRSKTIKNSPIIIETSSVILKTELLKSCKTYNIKHQQKLCAKHLGFKTKEDTPIYVSEQLTAKGARLFFLARDLTKSKRYKYCWTAFGRIYLREHDNAPIITVRSESQIHELLQKT